MNSALAAASGGPTGASVVLVAPSAAGGLLRPPWPAALAAAAHAAAAVATATAAGRGRRPGVTLGRARSALRENRVAICLRPPGTGKSFAMHCCIEQTLALGGRVLLTSPRAQLVSRMRARYGRRIDIETCAAAYGLMEDGNNPAACNGHAGFYALEKVDEVSQLCAEDFVRIARSWLQRDRICAFAFCGDKFQMSGFGTQRPWDTRLWRTHAYVTQLHELYRCKDAEYNRMLQATRTAKPHNDVVKKFNRHRAWPARSPTVADIRKVLQCHPRTTMMAFTRRGAATLNALALEAKHPRKAPLAVIAGDVEANPDNYAGGRLKAPSGLTPMPLPVYIGMPLYLTRNVMKDLDYVNGMAATVLNFNIVTGGLRVQTDTGKRILVTPWSDPALENMTYYPARLGYASTVMKFQGAELDHVTLYLDAKGVPGGAYTAASRVRHGKDFLVGGVATADHFTPAL